MCAESLIIETLPWGDALARHANAWENLVAEGGFNPSLLPEWMNAALVGHGAGGATSVHCFTENGRLVAVLPICSNRERIRGIPVRVARVASSLVSYHEELLSFSDGRQVLHEVLDQRMRGEWDVFRMVNVPYPSRTADAIESWARSRRYRVAVWEGEHSPYLAIDKDWSAYLQAQSKRFRANVKRVMRRPAEFGSAEMRWFERGADTRALLEDMLVVEHASWKQERGVSISSREGELRYHQNLLPFLERRGLLLANVLYANRVPIAYVLCANFNGWVGQLKTSFDARFNDTGASVITASVRRAFELGAAEYDFLGEADEHKLKWTSSIRRHRSYLVIGRTPIGLALTAGQWLAEPARWWRRAFQSGGGAYGITPGS